MAYVALYRKYRSQSFGELMGQEAVTTTLQNAIKSGRIAHAYLFHGARGCGKTSTARLLARALNCLKEDRPTPEPCGVCRLCTSIREGACMDVVEIDAASETSIDDVREKIIENVQYAPAEGRYKVYIIDEVHDLSAKAFDALLKTLEEPPGHVVFILATTEWHKVPITIRSRCQPFQFKRGSVGDLARAVQNVVDAEGYTAEPDAVQSIARSAEGSWRDALSLLEQVLAYSDGSITAETVHRAIGTVSSDMLFRVTETIAQSRWDATIGVAGELLNSGTDVRQLLVALHGHLRDLMLMAVGAEDAALQDLGTDRVAILARHANLFDPPALLAMMGLISAAEREIRFTNQHRLLLERTLLSMMPVNLARTPSAAPTAQPAAAPPAGARTASVPIAAAPPQREVEEEGAPPVPNEEPPDHEGPHRSAAARTHAPAPQRSERPDAVHSVRQQANGDAVEAPVEAVAAAQSAEDRFVEPISFDVVTRQWGLVKERFKRVSASGHTWLQKADVTALDGNIVVLTFTDGFARDRIHSNAKGRAAIEKTLNETLKCEGLRIRCEIADREQPAAPAPAGEPETLEMPALLDSPEPARTDRKSGGAQSQVHAEAPLPLPDAPVRPAKAEPGDSAPNSADVGMLAQTLNIFGGEVIHAEPLKS